ncbi:hypothetical protein [Janibacter sp. G1551]|uniref:hypothetical protein n=1 Tax=Janibacter sp. G1551 TaxID=3420440 RepID=UPI003D0392E0
MRVRRGATAARREAGAASLESVGLVLIAAFLVGAMVLALTQATPLAPKVRDAVCLIVTFGQGSCDSAGDTGAQPKPEPTTPCTTQSNSTSSKRTSSVVFVTLENGRKVQVESLSDGTYRVTASEGAGAGGEVGVGGGVRLTINDTSYGVSASANAGAGLTLDDGQVWNVRDAGELRTLFQGLSGDLVKDELVGRSGPIRWVADQVDGALGITTPVPSADETFTQGGFSVNASAEATGISVAGSAGVSASEALGIRTGADGSRTYYVRNTVEGEAGLRSLNISPEGIRNEGGKVEGTMTVVTAVTYDSEGNMTNVETTASGAGSSAGFANAAFGGEVDPALANGQGQAFVYRSSLPTNTQANRDVANAYLLSVGVQHVGTWTNPAIGAAATAATIQPTMNFFAAARDRGTMTQQSYDFNSNTPFALDAAGKVVIEIGVSGEVKTESMDITSATYWDGTRMAPWTGCTGSGTS